MTKKKKTGTDPVIHEPIAQLAVHVDEVHPYKKNPRQGDVDAIADSLARNGQYRPIVVNKQTGEILAGNHTHAAARQLGWTHIAATFVDVDEDQAARIVLADNRTADLGGYDDGTLIELLQGLNEDLAGTGYDLDDLDDLMASEEPAPIDDLEDQYGELSEDDLLVAVNLRVTPDVAKRWRDHADGYTNDDDALGAILP